MSTISYIHTAKFKFKAEQHGPKKRQRWNEVPRRSKHALPTGRARCVLIVKIIKREKNRSQYGV